MTETVRIEGDAWHGYAVEVRDGKTSNGYWVVAANEADAEAEAIRRFREAPPVVEEVSPPAPTKASTKADSKA